MANPLTSQAHGVDDDLEAVYQYASDQGWIDGLPIIPPTKERVERMIAGSKRPAADVVSVVPPNQAPATIEKVAINAVMAGCKPEYMPVIVTALEAAADPKFNLYALNTTTSSVSPYLIVNGPIRNQLNINGGYSAFGGGNFRANATIGRAVRLVMRNVGGAIEGLVSKSTMGQPGRITACVAEWEEKSPWPPLHVQRGFKLEQSTVTVFGSQGTLNVQDTQCKTAKALLTVIAHSIDISASNKVLGRAGAGEILLALCPDFSWIVSRDGWSVEDAKQFLYEETKAIPLSRFPPELLPRMEANGRIVNGVVPLCERPDQFIVITAGGLGGLHAIACHPFAEGASVTRAIPT
ncbi:MAG: hypothetical protein HY261_04350 [Chloroflexi bacterium]|nr:hypothetical protein [Chloroflexota bacterium]